MPIKYKIVLKNNSVIQAEEMLDGGPVATAIISKNEDGLRNLVMLKQKDISELYIFDVTEEEFKEIEDMSYVPEFDEEMEPQVCDEISDQYKSLPLSEVMYN